MVVIRGLGLFFLCLVLWCVYNFSGISVVNPAKDSSILAHRGFAGLWIQNSRNAVENTVKLFAQNKQLFDGIEIDISLTKDGVPVLSHDPWINQNLCAWVDGSAIPYTLIKDVMYDDLKNNYRCGGKVDPDFPNAELKVEPIIDLQEFLQIVKSEPELVVYLDVKLQEFYTAPIEQFTAAIFQRLEQTHVPNPLYIEGPDFEAVQHYQRHSSLSFKPVLSYPPFYADENWLLKGWVVGLYSLVNPMNALSGTQKANAEAVAIPMQLMNPTMQSSLQSANKSVIVYTPNTEEDFKKVCASGVDMLMTDYPYLGPCQKG